MNRKNMIIEERSLQEPDSAVRILLVEDSPQDADFVAMMLKRAPEMVVHIEHVASLGEAVDASHRGQFDIVLLDLGLPDSSGTESVLRLKACSPSTPIVVLTGDDRDDTAIAAIDSGAQDYLPKQHLVLQFLTRMMRHSITRQHRLIQAQSDALIDGLTGLANRRACETDLNRCLADFERHKHPFCVALFDIDHFKRVNDRWGHDAGDQVIKAVADVLTNTSRESDLVARYGGEEFAMVLSMTRLPDAQTVVLRCHRAISQLLVGEQQLRITASVGLAEITEKDDGRSLFARADEALYAAKHAARNRCMLHRDGGVTDGSQQILGAVAEVGD